MKISLDKLKQNDSKRIFDLFKDEDVFFTLGSPFKFETITLDQEIEFVKNMIDSVKNKNDLFFAIKLNNELIGCISTKGIDKKMRTAEVGYWIGKNYWGKGYATLALKQFLNLAWETNLFDSLWAGSYENNFGSIKVLEKNGFKKFKEENIIHSVTDKIIINVYYKIFKS